jgi:hypothetical protein
MFGSTRFVVGWIFGTNRESDRVWLYIVRRGVVTFMIVYRGREESMLSACNVAMRIVKEEFSVDVKPQFGR